jgi:hypothetical protein
MTALEHEPAPVELDRTTGDVVQKCRYRYATGCTAEYNSRPGLNAHEKSGPLHSDHRITLRDCPECGASCGNEMKRGMHMAAEHGLAAGSERRQELDARQVKELYDARQDVPVAAEVPVPDDAPAAQWPSVQQGTAATAPSPALTAPPVSPNGHSPAALDLSAARDMFAALVAEVERLRASLAVDPHVAEDASRYRQIRSVVNAAQD